MNINIVTYDVNQNVVDQIGDFLYNSFPKINILQAKDIDELRQQFQHDDIHIMILNPYINKFKILNFLSEINQHMTKIIMISSNPDDFFDFIKFNVYDYIIESTEINIILSRINRTINKINLELDFYQKKKTAVNYQKFIAISSTKKIELIKTEDIVYFEADGRYTNLFLTSGVSKMASKNLGEFQILLDPSLFCRIHHKYVINMDKLNTILKSDGYYCEMISNKKLPVSKRRITDLNNLLNIGKNSI